jgi:hypothetical protein
MPGGVEQAMRKAIIPIVTSLLESLLALPPEYKIIDVRPSTYSDLLNVTIASDDLPDVATPDLTQIQLHVTIDRHPDHPDFRRITVIPRVQKAIEEQKQ